MFKLLVQDFFALNLFIPHGHCYLWKPRLVSLHIASDSLIALAYYSIPITLIYFIQKRRDLPFNWIFLLFGAFIILCGTTHLMEIWTLWHPVYWLSGFLKAITAGVSVLTAMLMIPLVPQALALPNIAQMEATNRALLKAIPDLMMRISKEGIYLDVMPAKEIKTAIPKNKMVGKHLSEVLPPEIARQRMEYIEKALARGQTQIYEFELLINNEIRYQEARIAVIDENEVLIIVRDTTEAKLSEIALHKSEARFRAAIEGSFDAFYILESVRDRLGEIVDFKFVELNSRGSALVSLPKEAVIGSSLCELLPVNRTDGFFDKYKQVVETGVALEEEFSLAAPGLTASWIRHQIVPLGDGIAITSRDITDRKLVEEAWCKSEEQLQGILDNAPLCIYVKDTEGKYILASRRQETLFHIRREEIPGKTDYDIFPREMAEIFRANDLEVLATGTAVESEEVAPHDDGLHTYISIKFPLYDSAGIAYAVCGISTDITERKQASEKLCQKTSELEAIFEAFPDLYFRLDLNGTILDCHLGRSLSSSDLYTPPEIFLGKRMQDILPPNVGCQVQEAIRQLVETKSSVGIEYSLPIQNEEQSYEARLLPLLETEIFVIVRNISDRKRTEAALRQSEERYRSLVVATSQIVWTTDPQGLVVDIPEWRAYTGQSESEVRGWGWLEAIHPGDHDRTAKAWTQATSTKSLYETEYRIRAKSGNYRYFLARGIPVLAEDGSIREWVGVCIDIHDRKLVEQEQQKLIALVEGSSDLIGIANLEGQLIFLNEAGQKLIGIEDLEKFKQQSTVFECLMPEDLAYFQAEILPAVMERGSWEGEFRFRHSQENRAIPVYYNVFIVKDPQTGQPIGLATVTRDITERKQAEEELRRSEAQYRELARREELLNRLANQIRNSLELDTILETAVQEIRSLLQVERCNFTWLRLHASPPNSEIVKEAREPYLFSFLGKYPVNFADPIMQRTINLEIIRIDDTQNSPDPVVKGLYDTWGCRSLIMLPIQSPNGDVGIFGCLQQTSVRPWSDWEVELLAAVTGQIAIAISQAELYEQSCARAQQLEQTVKELKATQAQLIQTEKMSSLGQLVAGVAHEINNPVNFIYGNLTHADRYTEELLYLVSLYQKHYPQPKIEIQEFAENIELDYLIEDLPNLFNSMKVGANRIRDIVLSLRNFSRLDEAEMKAVDIHEGIDNTLLILQNRLKAKPEHPAIQVIKEYSKIPLVECYAGQLNQVFMNILTNAIDALDDLNKKRSIDQIKKNPRIIKIRTEIQNENQLLIQIADNGPGMTEDVRARLFDPFFTTKPVGQGTGLGMSISYQIVVEKHGGSIRVNSEIGVGTEFAISLPIK